MSETEGYIQNNKMVFFLWLRA